MKPDCGREVAAFEVCEWRLFEATATFGVGYEHSTQEHYVIGSPESLPDLFTAFAISRTTSPE
jgi:hypothetical protein